MRRGALLLIHGTSDFNAPLTATIQMIDALIRAGKPYDLVLLPDQDHAPSGPSVGCSWIGREGPVALSRQASRCSRSLWQVHEIACDRHGCGRIVSDIATGELENDICTRFGIRPHIVGTDIDILAVEIQPLF